MGLILKAWKLAVEALKAAREASEMAKAVRLAKASQQSARNLRAAQRSLEAAETAQKGARTDEEAIAANLREQAAAERKAIAEHDAQIAKEKAQKAATPIKQTKEVEKAKAAIKQIKLTKTDDFINGAAGRGTKDAIKAVRAEYAERLIQKWSDLENRPNLMAKADKAVGPIVEKDPFWKILGKKGRTNARILERQQKVVAKANNILKQSEANIYAKAHEFGAAEAAAELRKGILGAEKEYMELNGLAKRKGIELKRLEDEHARLIEQRAPEAAPSVINNNTINEVSGKPRKQPKPLGPLTGPLKTARGILFNKIVGYGMGALLLVIEGYFFTANMLSEQKKVPTGVGGDLIGVAERAAGDTLSDTGSMLTGVGRVIDGIPVIHQIDHLALAPFWHVTGAPIVHAGAKVAKSIGTNVQAQVIDPARQRMNDRSEEAIETPLITEDDSKFTAGMFNHGSSSAQPSPNPVSGTGSGRQGPAPAYAEHRGRSLVKEDSITAKDTEVSSGIKASTPLDPESARRAADRATFQKYLDSHKNDAPPPPSNPMPPPSADSGAIQSASYSLPATGQFAQPFVPSVVKTAVTSSIQATSAVSQAASFVPDKGGDAYAVTAVYTGLTTPNRPNYSQLARTTVTPITQGRVAIRPGQVVNLSGMSADYG